MFTERRELFIDFKPESIANEYIFARDVTDTTDEENERTSIYEIHNSPTLGYRAAGL
jgi:hypothetical protein